MFLKDNTKSYAEDMEEQFMRDGDKVTTIKSAKAKRFKPDRGKVCQDSGKLRKVD